MNLKFEGFTAGKAQIIAIPAQFFSDLLPRIDDLAELKVTLFCMWALQQKEGNYRYLRYDEFLADEALMAGLAVIDESMKPAEILDAALDKAKERETLLAGEIILNARKLCYYVINSEHGRTVHSQIASGEWHPVGADEIEVLPVRPNIHALYEENIGPLTPMLSEILTDAAKSYPHDWIEDAIKGAVEQNVRKWSYIAAILKGWQQEGRSRETFQGHLERHKQYAQGEWKDYIES